MPIPAIVAGILAAGTIAGAGAGAYKTYRGTKTASANLAYQMAMQKENARYWNEYYKNTGFRPRYPYRSGYVYNPTSMNNLQNVIDVAPASYISGFSYGAMSLASLYRPQTTYQSVPYNHYMYG